LKKVQLLQPVAARLSPPPQAAQQCRTIMKHVMVLLPMLLSSADGATKPHLVYVLSDNLGWGNVGYHRAVSPSGPSPEVQTPNIDQLVASGVELDRLYTYKFCSPSRASLLTGRFPLHVNMHNKALSIPGSGMPLGFTTIAQKLKSAGYATHAVGKWQCVGRAT
jgi:arylsulfatase B